MAMADMVFGCTSWHVAKLYRLPKHKNVVFTCLVSPCCPEFRQAASYISIVTLISQPQSYRNGTVLVVRKD